MIPAKSTGTDGNYGGGVNIPGQDEADEVVLIRVDVRVRLQWRIESLAFAVVFGLVLGGLVLLLPIPVAVRVSASLVVFVSVIGSTWMLVNVRYRYWRYGLGEDVLILEHGVWTRRRSMTPYYRVQNVEVSQGPLERRLGLKRLTIRTASASTDATIPGLDAEGAEMLRKRILERAGRDAAV